MVLWVRNLRETMIGSEILLDLESVLRYASLCRRSGTSRTWDIAGSHSYLGEGKLCSARILWSMEAPLPPPQYGGT